MSAVARTAASRRNGIGTRLAPWASQIGIISAFLLLWIAFVILAPRTFLDTPIYLSFAQTTPYFAIIAMALTMVIVAGDIDLSFPATMSLGMVGFVAATSAGSIHGTPSGELVASDSRAVASSRSTSPVGSPPLEEIACA